MLAIPVGTRSATKWHSVSRRWGSGSRVVVQSFHPESLRSLRSLLPPGFPLVQLLHGELEGGSDEVLASVSEYAVGVGPHFEQVDAEFMAAARRHGLVVHPYTVNDPLEMTRLLDLGADGIFTDRPDVLLELLRICRINGNLTLPVVCIEQVPFLFQKGSEFPESPTW